MTHVPQKPAELGPDRRHAVFAAREAGVWSVAAVRDGEVIQPDGPVDARQAADVVASVLPELAEQARGSGRRLDRLTRYCPRGNRCESCGADGPGLAVVIVAVLRSAFCLTLCSRCAESGRPPQIMLSTAERLAEQHARHLAGYVTP
jgi:hypothetical protein